MKVTIFAGTLDHLDANHVIFAQELWQRGAAVRIASIRSLSIASGSVHAVSQEWQGGAGANGGGLVQPGTFDSLEDSDLCWVMNQPHPAMATDVWQILWNLGTRIPFVNDIAGLVFMNNKSNLAVVTSAENLPETYVSADENYLHQVTSADGGSWVVKPTNGGAGNNVFVLEPDGPNGRALLQCMTGSAATQYELFTPDVLGIAERHAVLQRYLSQARTEVQRVLVCCGEVILNYGRRPSPNDHRSNYTHGGELTPVRALTDDERRLAEDVAHRLLEFGIRFGGIDMAYPYVLELNLANPGGVVNYPAGPQGNVPARRIIDLLCGSSLPSRRADSSLAR